MVVSWLGCAGCLVVAAVVAGWCQRRLAAEVDLLAAAAARLRRLDAGLTRLADALAGARRTAVEGDLRRAASAEPWDRTDGGNPPQRALNPQGDAHQ